MTFLITGINGFIGSWLSKELFKRNVKVCGIAQNKTKKKVPYKIFYGNIQDSNFVIRIIRETRPDHVYHLAAASDIVQSFSNPKATIDTNVGGTLNILEAVRITNRKIKLISVGSSAEYGSEAILSSPYAVSKVIQGDLVKMYKELYGLDCIHVRPFAIIGPGKVGDAISDFARGIAAIEKGKKKFLSVGELNHMRDFVDVRDAAVALNLIANKKRKHFIYDICLGRARRLKDMLEIMISKSYAKIIIKKKSSKIRKIDEPVIVGDPSRLLELGFKPIYSLEESLSDILAFWREPS